MLDGEKEIIKRAIKGEASAFGQLYNFYHPQIYRFLFIKVGHREEAEDLTHQVFLSAWQKIKQYKDKGFPFSSWLYQIARNAATDYYRKNKKLISIDEIKQETLGGKSKEIRQIEIDLEMEKVMKAIRKLKEDYQDVIIMRFIEEMSIKEISFILKKSEGSIKLLQHRAIRELKKELN